MSAAPPSIQTIPNYIASLSGSRYCIAIYNGVLGESNHSVSWPAIDDLNLLLTHPPLLICTVCTCTLIFLKTHISK